MKRALLHKYRVCNIGRSNQLAEEAFAVGRHCAGRAVTAVGFELADGFRCVIRRLDENFDMAVDNTEARSNGRHQATQRQENRST